MPSKKISVIAIVLNLIVAVCLIAGHVLKYSLLKYFALTFVVFRMVTMSIFLVGHISSKEQVLLTKTLWRQVYSTPMKVAFIAEDLSMIAALVYVGYAIIGIVLGALLIHYYYVVFLYKTPYTGVQSAAFADRDSAR